MVILGVLWGQFFWSVLDGDSSWMSLGNGMQCLGKEHDEVGV